MRANTIVLVVVDSLRYDALRADVMPRLSTAAEEGVECTDAHAAGAQTPSSMPALMQSRLPIDGGYAQGLDNRPALAEVLSDAGFATSGWHSNTFTTEERGFSRGFDEYTDLANPAKEKNGDGSARSWRDVAGSVSELLGMRDVAERAFESLERMGLADSDPCVRAKKATLSVENWVDETDGRRFAYLHLMDTHLPYLPLRPYQRAEGVEAPWHLQYDMWQQLAHKPESLTAGEIQKLHRLYHAEAGYVDSGLGHLFGVLRDRGLWDDALVLVTSDHGELFGERDIRYDAALRHPNYLCEEITHVPLVMTGGAAPTMTVESITSGLDVAPTLAEVAGADVPESWTGQHIMSERDEMASAVANRRGDLTNTKDAMHIAVRDKERAVLWWARKHPAEWFVRDESGEEATDPSPDRLETSIDKLRCEASLSGQETVENKQQKERLKALGYA